MTHILVLDQSGGRLESSLGSLFDIGLGVPNGTGKDRDDVRHCLTDLDRSRGDELLQDGQSTGLDLPFSMSLDVLEQGRENDKSGPGVHGLNDGLDSGKGGILDRGGLVGQSLEEGREWRGWGGRDHIGLEVDEDTVLADGRDGSGGSLSDVGGFLVSKSLLN